MDQLGGALPEISHSHGGHVARVDAFTDIAAERCKLNCQGRNRSALRHAPDHSLETTGIRARSQIRPLP